MFKFMERTRSIQVWRVTNNNIAAYDGDVSNKVLVLHDQFSVCRKPEGKCSCCAVEELAFSSQRELLFVRTSRTIEAFTLEGEAQWRIKLGASSAGYASILSAMATNQDGSLLVCAAFDDWTRCASLSSPVRIYVFDVQAQARVLKASWNVCALPPTCDCLRVKNNAPVTNPFDLCYSPGRCRVALNSLGHVFLSDRNGIREFGLDGSFKKETMRLHYLTTEPFFVATDWERDVLVLFDPDAQHFHHLS